MRLRHLTIPIALLAASGLPAAAQTTSPAPAPQTLTACQTQQELEQFLASDGQFVPDGCRLVSVTSLESEHGPLCVIDLEAADDPSVLDRLTDAAMPTQWWARCDSLSAIR